MLRRVKTYTIPGSYPIVFESCIRILQGHSMQMPVIFASGVQIAAANPQLGFITGYTNYLWRKIVRVDLRIAATPQGCSVTFQSEYLGLAFIDYGRFNAAIDQFFAKLTAQVLSLNATPQPMAYLSLPDGRPLSTQFFQPAPPPPNFAQTPIGQVVLWGSYVVYLIIVVVIVAFILSPH